MLVNISKNGSLLNQDIDFISIDLIQKLKNYHISIHICFLRIIARLFSLRFTTLIPFMALYIILLLLNHGSIPLLSSYPVRVAPEVGEVVSQTGGTVALPGSPSHRLGSPTGLLHRGGLGVRDM